MGCRCSVDKKDKGSSALIRNTEDVSEAAWLCLGKQRELHAGEAGHAVRIYQVTDQVLGAEKSGLVYIPCDVTCMAQASGTLTSKKPVAPVLLSPIVAGGRW